MKKQKYKHWENTPSQRFVKWLWDRFGVADRMHLRATAKHAKMEQGSLMNKVEELESDLFKVKLRLELAQRQLQREKLKSLRRSLSDVS